MKRNLFFIVLILSAIPTISNAQQKNWFFAGNLDAGFITKSGVVTPSVSVGLGIHRMLGNKFSAGVSAFYANYGGSNALGADLAFAYYGRLADRFYYVPTISAGVINFISSGATNFRASISPLGLEFRPTDRLRFRVNLASESIF